MESILAILQRKERAMKIVFLVIELLLFSSRASALDGGGFAPTPPNVYEHRNPAPAFTKSNNLKPNSDNHTAIGSTGRSNPKDLESQESESWWGKVKTDPNATFAGVVAVFTLGLVIVGFLQVTQLKKTLEATLKTAEATLSTAEATKASGEATKLLAEATLNIESPIIIVQKAKMVETGIISEEIKTSDLKISPFIRISVKNIGRTPAFLDHEFIFLSVLNGLTEEPKYPIKFKFPNGMVLEPGSSNEIQQKYNHLESVTNLVLEGKMFLWAYGYIAYKDFIGREHKTGFCFRWYPPEPSRKTDGRWEYEGPDSYLYMT